MQRLLLCGLFVVVTGLVALSASAEGSCEDVDFNGNGVVDEGDVETFKLALGKSAGEEGFLAAADLDGSGVVTPVDFGILLSCR